MFGGSGPLPARNTPVSQAYVYKFNTTTLTWERKASLLTARTHATAVVLPGGKIGIYGGEKIDMVNPDDLSPNAPTTCQKLVSAEIYDIATNTMTASIDLVGNRNRAGGVMLQSGYALIAGGLDATGTIVDSELIHRADPAFSGSTGTMVHPRIGHVMTNLLNGRVLITGGHNNADPAIASSAEVFDPQAKLYVKYATEQIPLGATLQLSAFDDLGAPVAVTWTTANATYGSVDASGLLTSTAPGTVEVTATGNGLTAIVRIKVLPK